MKTIFIPLATRKGLLFAQHRHAQELDSALSVGMP